MKRRLLSVIVLVSVVLCVMGDTLKGRIIDAETKEPIEGAYVFIKQKHESMTVGRTTSSDSLGCFSGQASMLRTTVEISAIGYYDKRVNVACSADTAINHLGDIEMKPNTKVLQELKVRAKMKRFILRGDTIVFNPEAFSLEEGERLDALLKKLPGIGDYTAAAIASMAYGQPEPAMDGNLTRVLARVTAEQGCVGETAVKRRLRAAGEALIDRERPGDFNQAMMGLGNLVCVPFRPRCEQCPVADFCRARELGCAGELPNMPPKLDKKKERRGVVIVCCGDRVLVRRRPENALLGGLWEYPNFENAVDADSLTECLAEMGVRARFVKKLGSANHVFTHKVWQMTAFLFTAEALPETEDLRGATADELSRLPMPTAMTKLRLP